MLQWQRPRPMLYKTVVDGKTLSIRCKNPNHRRRCKSGPFSTDKKSFYCYIDKKLVGTTYYRTQAIQLLLGLVE